MLWCAHSSAWHYNDDIMGAMASQITSLTIVYWTVHSRADQRKHESSASLAFVWGIHRWPVNSLHKWPVTRKMFPFDEGIMNTLGVDQCFPAQMVSNAEDVFIWWRHYNRYQWLHVVRTIMSTHSSWHAVWSHCVCDSMYSYLQPSTMSSALVFHEIPLLITYFSLA